MSGAEVSLEVPPLLNSGEDVVKGRWRWWPPTNTPMSIPQNGPLMGFRLVQNKIPCNKETPSIFLDEFLDHLSVDPYYFGSCKGLSLG